MKVLSIEKLREFCPLKWHEKIPADGIGLGIADIDFEGPLGIADFIRAKLKDEFAYYQPREGMRHTLGIVKEFIDKKGLHDAIVQIIPGTMIGIYAVMKYASQLSGKVAIINPIYPPIHFHASSENNEIQWIPLDDSYQWDHERIMEAIDKDTKMIAFANPNNPTGTVPSMSDLKLVRDLCIDYNIICFSDELYEPLAFRKEHVSIGSLEGMHDRTVSLYGFSKAYGLAGYRSGFMSIQLTNPKPMQEIVEHLLVSPSPVTSFVAEFALTNPLVQEWVASFKQVINQTTVLASKVFEDAGYSCPLPDGSFFVFPDLELKNDLKCCEDLLVSKGVEVVHGSRFGPDGAGKIRVNCATSTERLSEGIDRIIEYQQQQAR